MAEQKRFVVLVEAAPRTKRKTYHIGTLNTDVSSGESPMYESMGVMYVEKEARKRVAFLNTIGKSFDEKEAALAAAIQENAN